MGLFQLRSRIFMLGAFICSLFFMHSLVCFEVYTPQGFVSDYADLLKPEEKEALEKKLVQVAQQHTVEIAVVILKSLHGVTIEEATERYFNTWKIGKKDKDSGVLLLVAVSERQVRIEVGYGLEESLNDAKAGRIIRDIIVPSFKKGEYGQGIIKGSDAIIEATTHSAESVQDTPEANSSPLTLMIIIVFLLILATSNSPLWLWLLLIMSYIFWNIHPVFGIGFFLFFALWHWIFPESFAKRGYPTHRHYQRYRKNRDDDDFFIGSGGFGGFGGGGFGGFGGGSSGGGGASGRW